MLRVLHLMLAFNIFLSSSGIMVFEHLCQMRGKKIAYFIQPKSCCQKRVQFETSCCAKEEVASAQESLSRTPCCKDKSAFFKTDPNSSIQKIIDFSAFTPAILPQVLNPALAIVDFLPHNQKILRFYLYKPPPRSRDIPVFVQSFRC